MKHSRTMGVILPFGEASVETTQSRKTALVLRERLDDMD